MGDAAAGTGRVRAVSVLWAVLTLAATGILAWALPEVVSIGSCSTTGRLSGGNRDAATCTDDQVQALVVLFVGLAVAGLALLCSFGFVRGRDSLVLRLAGLGLPGVVAGLLAELKLREADVVASMSSDDLTGWKIGALPLLIGGAVCLAIAAIIAVVRRR